MKRDTRYYQQHGLLRIFLSYFGPHRRLFLLDMLCALFIGAVDLIFPLISRRAINTMLPAHAYHTFFVVMGIMAAAYLVRAFFYYIIAYYGHTFGIRVEADIRRDLFRHMQSLGYEFYDHNRTGQLMSRLTTDLFEITGAGAPRPRGPDDLPADDRRRARRHVHDRVAAGPGRVRHPADPAYRRHHAPPENEQGLARREEAHGGHQR